VGISALEKIDVGALAQRATRATSDEDRAECLADIEAALEGATSPDETARLLLCRARVRTNRWQTRDVLADALSAMALFEQAGDVDGTLDAASLGAGWASRLGQLSLAAELATKCIVRLGEVVNDSLVVEVTNRLGVFCYSFMDYARAIEQFEASLSAAERCGDHRRVLRQLHNIADTLLLSARQDISGVEDAIAFTDRAAKLAKAEQVVRRMVEEGALELRRRTGVHRLQAELLCEQGRYMEALAMLRQSRAGAPVEFDPTESNLALVEARCLRAIGRPAEAVAAVRRAAEIAEPSEDNQETMLILDELVAAEEDMGDLVAALRDAQHAKKKMWDIHRVQTAQLVEQVWARAAVEQERQGLETQAAAAMRFAEEDPLTRIGNRRLLERFMTELTAQSGLSVLMADVDHFKQINDNFGHDVGDHVLRAIGGILAHEARSGQVAIRYGGDEFLVGLPSVCLSSAADFAERLRLKVGAYRWVDIDARLGVTVSIGVAAGAVRAWTSVLATADEALYRAKGMGRNCVNTAAEPGATRSTT
jgi:diguanylate cyclase (GGDEF)-like protein